MNQGHTQHVSTATVSTVNWRLVFLLGAFALVRPVLSILGLSDGRPWVSILTTVVITVLWIGIVVWARAQRPVLTLALTGGMYGCLAIVLGIILQGKLAIPVFVLPFVIGSNAVWGAFSGVIAAGIDRKTAE